MEWKQRVRDAMTAAGQAPDEDVVEELAQHLQSMYEGALAAGGGEEEAASRVARQLALWAGDAESLKRRARRAAAVLPPPATSLSWLHGLAQDVRYAARLCRRQTAFTLLVVFSMALGIGAVTTLFSVTYGVLMRPLPWPASDRLVVVKETRGDRTPRFGSFTNAAYVAWREQPVTIDELAAWSRGTATLTGAGEADRIGIIHASASLFTVLGAHPLAGAFFEQQDEASKDSSVIVISEALWRQRFGADRGAVGRVVRLDGEPHTVVGVMPDRFAFPDHQARAWVPFRVPLPTGNLLSLFNCIARLRPGATAAQAAAEGTARGRFAANTGMTTQAIFGGSGPIRISAEPLRDAVTAEVRQPLIVLLAAVLLLLLTTTVNVASLQLVRATARNREMAIRSALGAGAARVTRQLLLESVLLGVAGGAAGLFLARLLHGVLPSVLPPDFPRVEHIQVDTRIVLFAFVVSLLTGVLFGLAPALRLRRLNLAESLAENTAAAVGVTTRSRTGKMRLLLTVAQIAIAFVLLVGASLLGRSFVALLTADRGYDPSGLLTARLSLPGSMYTPERRFLLVDQILGRLGGVPNVADAAFTSDIPLTPGGSTSAFQIRSPHADGGTVFVQAAPRLVAPRYFAALRMRVLAGRTFSESDTETSPPVVVVNQAFARKYLGNSPIGAQLPMAAGYEQGNRQASVIGVIDNIRYLTAADSSHPEIYFSFRQLNRRLSVPVVTLLLRTPGDPSALIDPLRTAVGEADEHLVAESVMTLEDRMWTSLVRPRLYAVLLGGFAGFALIIAAVGLFGVLSYAVAQRSREFALRTALGATKADIVRLVGSQGLKVTAAGLVAGFVASVALMRSIGSLLYGVTQRDALTYVAVPVILLLVAAAACLAPAWRASRLDPQRLLREG